jgi:hypothetical protein
MESKCKLKRRINVQIHNTKGELLWEGHNSTVNSGLNLIVFLLAQQAGVTTYSGLSYCAIGTSNTAIAAGQTQLVAESARLAFTSAVTIVGNQLTVQTYFAAASCSVVINEMGIFGNGATGAANSGTMFARVLALYDNSLLAQDLIVTWSIALTALD